MRQTARAMTVAALAALVGTVAACGGGSGDGTSQRASSITVAETAQPDSLDPAVGYTLNSLEPGWLVYTPLLTYPHTAGRAGATLVPGLAERLPAISPDGRTYRLTLRPGLTYSDGTPVRAGDFKHAVRRVLALKSPGASFLAPIQGAQEELARGRPGGPLPGIATDDRSRAITIRLVKPDATFSNVLAMPFTAPVPRSTPFRNLTAAPPPGVGAYAYRQVHPGQDFTLERNPRFDVPGIPPAHIDRITVKVVTNQARQTEDVLRGQLDYAQDPPPPDLLPTVRRSAADRYREFPTASTVYFFLNHAAAPFSDPRLRQAAELALDRNAARRLFGGLLQPACNVLPATVPGYRAVAPCPWSGPGGASDMTRARALVRAAGATGAKVTVWGPRGAPADRLVTAYADALRQTGLAATPKLVDFSQYLTLVGTRATGAQAGLLLFSQDFPHPADFLRQFSGSSITPTGNLNLGNVNDPQLTAAIDRLGTQSDLRAAAPGWAAVDRGLVERAHVVPVGEVKRATFLSSRMNPGCVVVHPVYVNDWSSFCLR